MAPSMDNETVVQVLFSTFRAIAQSPEVAARVTTLDGMLDYVKTGMVYIGYTIHHSQIQRSELKDTIYYAKLDPTGQLLLNNYHPLHLRGFMAEEDVPDTFNLIFQNSDYLPNIIVIWDRNSSLDSLISIRFQKVNVHVTPPMRR
jgi:hypothetical protein